MRIESGSRLVENEDLRAVDKRAGYVYAPSLPAAEFTESAVYDIAEIEKSGEFVDPCRGGFAGDSVQRGTGNEVVADGERAVKYRILKNHADIACDRGYSVVDVVAVYDNLASVFTQRSAHYRNSR